MYAFPFVIVAMLLGLVGCGAESVAPPNHEPMTISAGVTDNGHTVTLVTGQRLAVSLNTTFWTFSAPGNVVRVEGGQRIDRSHPCVPGGGCGTVTEVFDAVATGQTTIAANRTTCGEAMRCVGNAGAYRLTVIVRAGP